MSFFGNLIPKTKFMYVFFLARVQSTALGTLFLIFSGAAIV